LSETANRAAPARAPCWCGGVCPHVAPLAELEAKRRFPELEAATRRRLVLAPDCPELHKRMARMLEGRNFAHAAAGHWARAGAAEISAELEAARVNNARLQARLDLAEREGKEAVARFPDSVAAVTNLAYALHAAGKLEETETVLEAALIRFGPAAAGLRRLRALHAAEHKDFAAAIALLNELEAGGALSPAELLDRGRYHEKLGAYGAAWSDWMEAKRIQREAQKLVYRPELHERHVAELMEASRPPRGAVLEAAKVFSPPPWPIFITGFPRSGTTMIEAALSAHRSIVPGDELAAMPDLIRRMPAMLNAPRLLTYPRVLAALAWPENVSAPRLLRATYMAHALERLGASDKKGFCYFTDKMTSNELHWPLLAALFPESPILHVRRHPLDILVSCMSQFLVHGGHNACALEWCAHHYAITDALTDHYKRKCPPPRLLEVRYEEFLADVPAGVEKITPAELAPDAASVDFHLNPWHARTLSYRQIKEPAHTNSVGRYRPFLDFLKPVLPVIAPTLERESYEI
jgi:tetratricopeptide (TPR) repeat protein